MTTLTKEQFIRQFQNRQINIADLPQDLQKAIQKKGLDLDQNGKISGDKEIEKLFHLIDSFDRDGNPETVTTNKRGRITKSGQHFYTTLQHAKFDSIEQKSLVDALNHMKKLKTFSTQEEKIDYLTKAYPISRAVAEQTILWTQLHPHPTNPDDPHRFVNAMNQAQQGTLTLQTRLVGSFKQDNDKIYLRLSDGSTLDLPKYERLMLDEKRTKHFTTTLVDQQGNAHLSQGLTPETDRNIRNFLKNLHTAIQKQKAVVAAASGADRKLENSKLQELMSLKSFGVRVFLNIEAIERRLNYCVGTKDVVENHRFTNGKNTDFTKIETMLKLKDEGRSYALSQITHSKEVYRGMRGY